MTFSMYFLLNKWSNLLTEIQASAFQPRLQSGCWTQKTQVYRRTVNNMMHTLKLQNRSSTGNAAGIVVCYVCTLYDKDFDKVTRNTVDKMLQVCQYIFQSFPLKRFLNFGGEAYKSSSTEVQRHTAGLIIIGDEILKAQVKDTNSHFMCTLLYECGVRVKKISVISDDVDVIANEIRGFSEKYTYVITSGGIGPTHDDMTFEGLAKAFNDSLHYNPTLLDIVKKLLKIEDPDSPGRKLALIPKQATLKFGLNPITGKPSNYPCITLRNIYVFPGSPIFLEPLFTNLYEELFKTNRVFVKKELYIDAKEDTYAVALTNVANEFPRVTFGSYPVSDQSVGYKARVTIESDDENETNEARDKFMSLLPSSIFVNCQ